MTPWVEMGATLTTEYGPVPLFTVDLRNLRNRLPVKVFKVAEFDREMNQAGIHITKGNVDNARARFVVLENKDAGRAKMVVFPPCDEHEEPKTVESVVGAYSIKSGMPELEVVGSGEVLIIKDGGAIRRVISVNLPERNRESKPIPSQTEYDRETFFGRLGGTRNFQLVSSEVIKAYIDQLTG